MIRLDIENSYQASKILGVSKKSLQVWIGKTKNVINLNFSPLERGKANLNFELSLFIFVSPEDCKGMEKQFLENNGNMVKTI